MESGSDRTTPSPAAQDRIAPSRPSFSGGRGRRATTSSAAAHCDASTLEAFEALPASPDDPDAQHRLADFLAAVLSQISPETGGNAVEGGDDGEASPAAAAAVAVEQRQPGNAARPGMTITQPGGLHVFVKLVRACPRWAQVEAWDQLLSLARHRCACHCRAPYAARCAGRGDAPLKKGAVLDAAAIAHRPTYPPALLSHDSRAC